jgi:hypothetical protein
MPVAFFERHGVCNGAARMGEVRQGFPDCNRDRDPDKKPFRKNRGSILFPESISDFQIKIGSRFSLQNRSAMKKPLTLNSPVGAMNRDPVFVQKSISGFRIKIGSRFPF